MTELLERERRVVEAALDGLVPAPGAWPVTLHRAMSHALTAGGKRLRPILARLAHRAAGGDPDAITTAACGLELVHTYSLVHDDLPAMDDDILRRGRPTVHVAFGEATAILAGDALLAEGLLLLARHPLGPAWAERRAEAVAAVAEAVSARGMVGGQMEDIETTANPPADPAAALERIHRHKTGCLLSAAVEVGAILAGAGDAERDAFRRFGANLGLAFQVADDILDATGSAAELGKSPGKDAAHGKLTYVTLHGLDAARTHLATLEDQLLAAARALDGDGSSLATVVRFVAHRTR